MTAPLRFTRTGPTAFIPAESIGLGITVTATTDGAVLLRIGNHPHKSLSAAQAHALATELQYIAAAAEAASKE